MSDTTATDKSRLRLVTLIVAVSMFMANLDMAIVNTSLPQLAQSFNVSAVDLSAGITAYILATAVFLPLSTWITDRYGTRAVFAAAIVVFTLASVACGAAATLTQFVIARAVQGAGAALMTPVGRAVVLKNAEKRDLMDAVALLTWPGLLGPVIAPVLGGFITTYISWRWNFLLNAPLGAVAVVLAWRYVPADAGSERRPLDVPGLLWSSTALFCLIYSLESFSAGHGDGRAIALLATLGAIGTVLAVRHFRRARHPLLDLSPFDAEAFRITDRSAGLIFRCTIAATPFLLPLLLQLAYGLNPLQAGGFIMTYFIGNLIMKPVTTPILRRFGFRNVLIVNGLLSGAAILACGFVSPVTVPWLANGVFLLTGLTRSMQFTCLNTLGFSELPADKRSAASTLHSMMLQLSMALGVAGVALVLQKSAAFRAATSLALIDFRIAFVFVGVVGMVSALMFMRLRPDAGAEVSGHGAR
jgi:EmrB/QacA subfamily drug resistance transporter